MKNILAKDLTKEQKLEFTLSFYERSVLSAEDEMYSQCPWSCPWLSGGNKVLVGDTVSEMVDGYLRDYEDEIRALLSEQE